MKKYILFLSCLGTLVYASIPDNTYVFFLAGGSGTRLWPLSYHGKPPMPPRPKQLIPLADGSTLLDRTVTRVQDLIPQDHRWIVTTQQFAPAIEASLKIPIQKIVIEPAARNTGPALLYACYQLAQIDPDAIFLSTACDQAINDDTAFINACERAITYASTHNEIVILGTKPQYPATNYGYIEAEINSNALAHHVTKFHEKPCKELAEQYCTQSNMFWNTSVICARVSVLLEEFKQHAPELVAALEHYETMPSISVDYAVLEKSSRVAIVPCYCELLDLGTLETFTEFSEQDAPNPIISVLNAHNNLVNSQKTVILAGVENITVIETDDLILVAARTPETAPDKIRTELQKQGLTDYL